MPKLEDIDPTLDPIVRAAMIDDPDEEEDEPAVEPEKVNEEPSDDEEGEAKSPTEDQDGEDDETDKPESDDHADEVPEKDTPAKEETAEVDTETPKLTRKEKREAKRQRYLDTVRREGEQTINGVRQDLLTDDPDYKPLDYTADAEYDGKELSTDRDKFGQKSFVNGVKTERYYAEQDKFWTVNEYEDQILTANPKYAFLDENNVEAFDEDKAADLNERYLDIIGYDEKSNTVQRTDISWKKFVESEVKRVEDWAEQIAEQQARKQAEQRSRSGIRPTGSAKKGLGQLQPGDISKMSAEEFEKNEAEIDRQIMAQLG